MSMADRDGVIWFDGEMVPWRDAKVHVLTHTLHYGLGVFEGVRAYNTDSHGTAIFRLKEHTDRLFRSAHILNMEVPYSKDVLNEAQRAVVRENGLEEAYLRPMLPPGTGRRICHPKPKPRVSRFAPQAIRDITSISPCARQRQMATTSTQCWR